MPQNARMLFKHVMGPLDTLTSHFSQGFILWASEQYCSGKKFFESL